MFNVRLYLFHPEVGEHQLNYYLLYRILILFKYTLFSFFGKINFYERNKK